MKKSTQESFYLILIEVSINEEARKKVLPILGGHFEKTFKEFEEVDYPAIYRTVSDSTLIPEDIELLLEVLIAIEESVSRDGHKRVAQKMRRHFQLSYEQKARFDQLDEKFKANLDESEQTLVSLQLELAKVQDELSDAYTILETIDNESSKIYAQFVTILGIFTAIVVSVFGGLSIVSGVFNKINETPMWKIVLTGSTVSIFVLCLLFLLTRWISTIVQRSFGYDSEHSLMQVITNNGAFASGIFIFCYLIIAAVVFSSKEATNSLKKLMNVWDSFPVLILLALPILAGSAVLIKTIDLRKYKR